MAPEYGQETLRYICQTMLMGGKNDLATLVIVRHNCYVCISKVVSELRKIFLTEVLNCLISKHCLKFELRMHKSSYK